MKTVAVILILTNLWLAIQAAPLATQQDQAIFDVRLDTIPTQCKKPASCAEATRCTKQSGYYEITNTKIFKTPFIALCDATTDGGNWTVIQRRHDNSVDFHLNWASYKVGFGDINGEFFIGLEKLYGLTNNMGPQELMIVMQDSYYNTEYALYDSFAIGTEAQKYHLRSIGKYSGTAGESLHYHMGASFSATGSDFSANSCTNKFRGGWWYKNAACLESNLSGTFNGTTNQGLVWKSLTALNTSLKSVKMMVRRRRS